jgi:hypothetical protein
MKSQRKAMYALVAPIHEILIRDWDPIGVGECPEAQDEYDSYILVILRLLLEGADERKIADHLENLATVSMGMGGNPAHSLRIAQILRRLVDVPSKAPEQ